MAWNSEGSIEDGEVAKRVAEVGAAIRVGILMDVVVVVRLRVGERFVREGITSEGVLVRDEGVGVVSVLLVDGELGRERVTGRGLRGGRRDGVAVELRLIVVVVLPLVSDAL